MADNKADPLAICRALSSLCCGATREDLANLVSAGERHGLAPVSVALGVISLAHDTGTMQEQVKTARALAKRLGVTDAELNCGDFSVRVSVSFSPGVVLPKGLNIPGDLNLEAAAMGDGFRLPEGLVVLGWLEWRPVGSHWDVDTKRWKTYNHGWDGKIPEDAVIMGIIWTEVEQVGRRLDEWHMRHPDGESVFGE